MYFKHTLETIISQVVRFDLKTEKAWKAYFCPLITFHVKETTSVGLKLVAFWLFSFLMSAALLTLYFWNPMGMCPFRLVLALPRAGLRDVLPCRLFLARV